MKTLAKKLENRIIVRLFAFMGIGAGISSAVAYLLTRVPEYREFLCVPNVENELMLTVSGWVLLILPLVMYLVVPKDLTALSFPAVGLIFVLFSGLIGASLSGVALVFIKSDIARGLLVAAGMFLLMSLTGAVFRRDMISWHCILLTAGWGILLSGVGWLLFPCGAVDAAVMFVVVVVYCAVTAYSGGEMLQIIAATEQSRLSQMAIRGALAVYLNFVGLAVKMLRFWQNKGKNG